MKLVVSTLMGTTIVALSLLALATGATLPLGARQVLGVMAAILAATALAVYLVEVVAPALCLPRPMPDQFVESELGVMALALGALALGIQVPLPVRMVLSAVALPIGLNFLWLCLTLRGIVP
ncbi:hypothetical protein FOA52_003212 [Chlamydomonas sp. UWO 241]|nr:hypothetical protein FOA52_003212 [Chlamydomonas sp. UWO 241]